MVSQVPAGMMGSVMMGAIASVGLVLVLSACHIASPIAPSNPVSQADSPHSLQSQIELGDRWIVSASEARDLAQQGATILDARLGATKDIPGASVVTWQQFSKSQKPYRGQLKSDDAELTQQLQSLGISSQKPVLVIGSPQKGWGEEGRIVWMLRTFGHQQAYMLEGDAQFLTSLKSASEKATAGDFIVKRDPRWTIDQVTLRQQLSANTIKLIDSREPREYAGKTPYGEDRGGHLDGAQNLYFKDFLGDNGRLLPRTELVAKLEQLGITPADQIVVYCTGGIRSGWLTAVLVSLGYPAKNYPGSMWEWSAFPAEQYPLVKSAS